MSAKVLTVRCANRHAAALRFESPGQDAFVKRYIREQLELVRGGMRLAMAWRVASARTGV